MNQNLLSLNIDFFVYKMWSHLEWAEIDPRNPILWKYFDKIDEDYIENNYEEYKKLWEDLEALDETEEKIKQFSELYKPVFDKIYELLNEDDRKEFYEEFHEIHNEPIDEDEELRKIYSSFSREELLAELDEVEDERVRYFIYEALYNLEQR